MLSIKELQSSTKKELTAELKKARQKGLATAIAVKTKHNKDSSQVKKNKVYVARVLTALGELEKEEVKKAAAKPAPKAEKKEVNENKKEA